MIDAQTLQTTSILVTSAGLLIAALYYVLQIRHQTRIRKTDLIIRLYSKISSPEFRDTLRTFMNLQFKDYDDYGKKYGEPYSKTDEKSRNAVIQVSHIFELVGTLLYRGYIDLNLVYDVFGVSMIKDVYEKSIPLIVGTRRETNEPSQGAGFVYLYNEIMRKEQQLKKTWTKASLLPVTKYKLPNELPGAKDD